MRRLAMTSLLVLGALAGAAAADEPLAVLDGSRITLLRPIEFDLEKTTIKRASFAVIDAVAEVLVAHPELRVRIEGHLDRAQHPPMGRKLSQQRAQAVRDYLIAKRGIDPQRLEALGFEGERPLVWPGTREQLRKNRRIEIHVLPPRT